MWKGQGSLLRCRFGLEYSMCIGFMRLWERTVTCGALERYIERRTREYSGKRSKERERAVLVAGRERARGRREILLKTRVGERVYTQPTGKSSATGDSSTPCTAVCPENTTPTLSRALFPFSFLPLTISKRMYIAYTYTDEITLATIYLFCCYR